MSRLFLRGLISGQPQKRNAFGTPNNQEQKRRPLLLVRLYRIDLIVIEHR